MTEETLQFFYFFIENSINIPLRNLLKCCDALSLEREINFSISHDNWKLIFKVEDALLNLATTPFVYGIFSVICFKIANNITICRFIEFGSLKDFNSIFLNEMKEKNNPIFMLCSYTNDDIV